jgi:hypothetical protein
MPLLCMLYPELFYSPCGPNAFTLFFFFFVCSLRRVIVLSTCLFVRHVMYPELLMFEVHHGGRFNREHRVTYVGGDISHYPDPYDRDELSFIEI